MAAISKHKRVTITRGTEMLGVKKISRLLLVSMMIVAVFSVFALPNASASYAAKKSNWTVTCDKEKIKENGKTKVKLTVTSNKKCKAYWCPPRSFKEKPFSNGKARKKHTKKDKWVKGTGQVRVTWKGKQKTILVTLN